LLFLLHLNKRIEPVRNDTNDRVYENLRAKAQKALRTLKGYEYFRPHFEGMDDYMSTGFNESQVRFAHELGNLADKDVVTKVSATTSGIRIRS
jgi:hypothetical protein